MRCTIAVCSRWYDVKQESASTPSTSTSQPRVMPSLEMRTSTRSSMSSSRSTHRCLRQACRMWCADFATRHLNGRASSGAHSRGPSADSLTHGSRAWTGIGRLETRRPQKQTTRCDCSRRSIRSSGIAGGSSCCGDGRIASRRIRRCRSGSSVTTRFHCSGATR